MKLNDKFNDGSFHEIEADTERVGYNIVNLNPFMNTSDASTTHFDNLDQIHNDKNCISYKNLVGNPVIDQPNNTQSLCLRPEDLMFMIRNTDTGNFYDIRVKDTVSILDHEDKKLTKIAGNTESKPWEDWWERKKEINNKLLLSAERNELITMLNLLNKAEHNDLIADINTKNVDGFTALHIAASEGYVEMTMSLIKLGADINTATLSLRTPLHVACIRGYTEIIAILIQAKSNLNCQDKNGNTPIHILSEGGWNESLEICLNYNPDITIKNIHGETALEVAANIETRNVFLASIKQNKVKLRKDGYERIVYNDIIFHNNRADVVRSLLFKAQQLEGIEPSLCKMPKAPNPLSNEEKKEKSKPKSRRIKILEAAKMISSIANKKDENSSNDEAEQKIRLDQFEIIVMLGKGSFGEVYLVKYKPTEKLYAMKTLSKRRFVSQNLLRYAQTERNVLCFTNSPFIVGLDFAFQTSNKLILVLEYCPG